MRVRVILILGVGLLLVMAEVALAQNGVVCKTPTATANETIPTRTVEPTATADPPTMTPIPPTETPTPTATQGSVAVPSATMTLVTPVLWTPVSATVSPTPDPVTATPTKKPGKYVRPTDTPEPFTPLFLPATGGWTEWNEWTFEAGVVIGILLGVALVLVIDRSRGWRDESKS